MPWYGWIIAGVLVLLALWAVGALVIGDRAKGRRRCPKCWHSLEGLPRVELEPKKGRRGKARTRDKSGKGGSDEKPGGWICPECGRAVRRENDLFRTRRKLGIIAVVAVGLLAGLAWYGYGVHQRRAEGKTKWVPSLAAVVLIRPLEPGRADPAWNQALRDLIVDRRNAGSMRAWERDLLAWRFIRILEDRIWSQVYIRESWVKGQPIPVYMSRQSISGGLFSEGVSLALPGVESRMETDSIMSSLVSSGGYSPSRRPRTVSRLQGVNGVIPPSHTDEITIELVAHLEVSTTFYNTQRVAYQNLPHGSARSSPAWNTQNYSTTRTVRREFTIRLFDTERELLESGVIRPVRDRAFDADHPIRNFRVKYPGRLDRWIIVDHSSITGVTTNPFSPECVALYDVELVYKDRVMYRMIDSFPDLQYPYGFGPRESYQTVLDVGTSLDAADFLQPKQQTRPAPDDDTRTRLGVIDESWDAESSKLFEDWLKWHRYMKVKGLLVKADMSDWVFRLTPRPDLALRCPQYDEYWVPSDGSGVLEIPLMELEEPVRSIWPADLFKGRTSPPPPP